MFFSRSLLRRSALVLVLLVFPASNNYALRDYTWGGGGTEGSDSTNYSMNAVLGEVSENQLTGTNYNTLPGLAFTQMAAVPSAPTLANTSNYYNQLRLTIATSDNPSDTLYAVAISTDNFSTTQYVQSDNTIGASLGSEDWQTYTNWGGASGEFIVGLDPGTTYYVKVKAQHGGFTETSWGPVASTATSSLAISFDIDVASTDTESSAPYELDFGSLTPGSVTTTSDQVWIDLATNAANGGSIFLYGSNSGLYSTTADYTISAVTGNLTALSEGFGLQYVSVTQSAGGPMAVDSPFDGTSENVGTLTTSPQRIFNSSASPVTAGRASFVTKAKPSSLAPAATDYTDTITIVAAANF